MLITVVFHSNEAISLTTKVFLIASSKSLTVISVIHSLLIIHLRIFHKTFTEGVSPHFQVVSVVKCSNISFLNI
ncbi:hypothetical protein ACFLY2_00845 [Patescibacteria group bacterium]